MLHHPHVPDTHNVEILTGEPKKAVRFLFFPTLVSLLVMQVNIFVDNVWCASLGVDAASALAVVATLYYFFTHTAAALGIGLNVSVANRIGAGNKEGAESCCRQMIVLTTLCSFVAIALCLYFTEGLITAIGGDSIRGLCREYLQPMFVLSTFILLVPILSGMLSGEGASRKSGTINIVCALANIILDPIFIFGLDMGVAGASVATCLSCVVSVALALWYYYSGKTYLGLSLRKFRVVKSELRDVMYVSLPQILERNVSSLANLLLVIFIIGCGGSIGLAIYNLPFKIVHVVMVPASAFASALIPVISSSMGMNDPERMRAVYLYGLKIVTLMTLSATVLTFVFAYPAISIFSATGDMVQYHDDLTTVLRIYTLTFLFYGFNIFGASILPAVKRSDISAVGSVAYNVSFITIVYICCMHTMMWVYWGVALSLIIGGLVMIVFAHHFFASKYYSMGGSEERLYRGGPGDHSV